MSEQKMGGKDKLAIRISGAPDVPGFLLSKQEGGTFLERGFRDVVAEKHGVDVHITSDALSGLDEQLEKLPGELGDGDVDVLLLSLRGEVEGDAPADEFEKRFDALIGAVKAVDGPHIIVFNCSSVDPDDDVHSYHGREDTTSLRVHRFNLALMRMSMLEGVSIIDVERLIAQLGGEKHVSKPFHYSETAHEAIRDELLRVLEDIGFFEERDLVAQIGQRHLQASGS